MGKIETFEFKDSNFHHIENYKYAKNWPVVYILEGGKEAYIGETTDAVNRSKQHYKKPEKRRLGTIHIIADDDFNKSATLDIESSLIEYIAADGKYKLQNGNAGLVNHNYYERLRYKAKFEQIWDELKRKFVVNKDLIEIRNSDLFKYSPYKSLTEDQYLTAQLIVKRIKDNTESKTIVKGEPGTGKTILAVYLIKYLKELEETKDMEIGLVIPMTSLRGTIKKVFKNVKGLKSSMVIGPNDVVKKRYDLLIVDEAHRLNRRVNITNMHAFDVINKKLGLDKLEGDQLDWINFSAKHTLYFYDANQSIKPSDVRREKFNQLNATTFSLKSQMRVLGGNDYINYIQNILNLRQISKKTFDNYEFIMFDNVEEMVKAIKKKDARDSLARVVAGYSWEWKSNKDPKKYDIFIDKYKYRWNKTNKDWVNSPTAIDEVGCIHTVQGYDLNYAGVIIGNEIGYNGKEIVIKAENYHDMNGKKTVKDPQELKGYIINIYKTLLTRGIRGTYIYVCDLQLREYFRKFVDTKEIELMGVAEEIGEYKLQ